MNLLLMFFFLFLTISESSEQNNYYLGVGFTQGNSTLTSSISNSGVSTDTEYEASSIDMKVGLLFDTSRIQLSYDVIDSTKDTFIERYNGFNIDYYSIYKYERLSLFWALGMGSYSYENSELYVVGNNQITGTSYNYSVGIFYDITKLLSLELAYAGKYIEWEDLYQSNDHNIIYSNTYIQNVLYYGLNFKF